MGISSHSNRKLQDELNELCAAVVVALTRPLLIMTLQKPELAMAQGQALLSAPESTMASRSKPCSAPRHL